MKKLAAIISIVIICLTFSIHLQATSNQETNNFNIKKSTVNDLTFKDYKGQNVSFELKNVVTKSNSVQKTTINNLIGSERTKYKSGLQEIILNGADSGHEQNFYFDDNSIKSGTNEDKNNITVLNEKIISADDAIVYSLGGSANNINLYPSKDSLENEEDIIQVSGAGFDGQYIETVEYNDKLYAKVIISGLECFVDINDVQILPRELIQSQDFYKVIDGEWYFYEAINPALENKYNEIIVNEAPSWAVEGEKYYSFDGENFYSNPNVKNESFKGSSYSYFQNLPMRSSSMYTSQDYKKYLADKGKTSSEYYNHTNAFIDAQNDYKVNSLLLFSMAANESAWGTSTYASKCYNFFGRAANDSNPDNACKGVNFSNAYSGIYSQSIFLGNEYMDNADYRFFGSELGDKSHGMNVKYASDPSWGAKAASIAYEADKAMGKNENKYFRIYKITRSLEVYKDSVLSKKQQICKSYDLTKCSNIDYLIKRNKNSDGYYSEPRVIVNQDINGKAFRFQLDTPRNNTSSNTCKFTFAKYGSSPNYEGTNNLEAKPGISGFGCQYGNWDSQTAWYNMKASDGNWSYIKINDVSPKSPSEYNKKIETSYYPSGNLECYSETTLDDTGKKISNEKWCYNDASESTHYTKSHVLSKYDGKQYIADYLSEQFNSSGALTYRNQILRTNNIITKRDLSHYYSDGSKKDRLVISYFSNGIEKDYLKNEYYENGVNKHYGHLMRNSNGSREYERVIERYTNDNVENDSKLTFIGTTGKIETSDQNSYYPSGQLNQRIIQKYNSNNYNEIDYKKDAYYENGKHKHYGHVMRNSNGTRDYERTMDYYSNGTTSNDLMLTYIGATGREEKRDTKSYYSSGQLNQQIVQKYDSKTYKERDYVKTVYYENGRHKQYGHVMRNSNGTRDYERTMKYYGDGTTSNDLMLTYIGTTGHEENRTVKEYYSSGQLKKSVIQKYDSNTYKERDYIRNEYDVNGKSSAYGHVMRHANGTKEYERTFNYKNTILVKDIKIDYYNNGLKQRYIEKDYDPNTKVQIKYNEIRYFSSGKVDYERLIIRDKNGTVISDEINNH